MPGVGAGARVLAPGRARGFRSKWHIRGDSPDPRGKRRNGASRHVRTVGIPSHSCYTPIGSNPRGVFESGLRRRRLHPRATVARMASSQGFSRFARRSGCRDYHVTKSRSPDWPSPPRSATCPSRVDRWLPFEKCTFRLNYTDKRHFACFLNYPSSDGVPKTGSPLNCLN